jgi:twitching motility protein PilT
MSAVGDDMYASGAEPYDGPSITAASLIDALISSGVLDQEQIDTLLGADRHRPTLDILERALRGDNLISEARLFALKGAVSGLPVAEDPNLRALPVLSAGLAKSAGAMVLDLPHPVVAFVEDLTLNVERVRAELKRNDFEVWLVTATRFTDMYRAAYQGRTIDARPTTASILEIFDEAVVREASDIHLSVGRPPGLRINGDLMEMNRQPLSDAWLHEQFRKLLGDAAMEQLAKAHTRDAGYGYGNVRFRINLGHDLSGMTAAIRRLPSKIPSFDELGLPMPVRKFCDLERGLILVTGPTGSGKSTTLASMLAFIGLNQSRHILTLEDPVEFIIPARRSIVHQREMGSSFSSFAEGLRQSLRQDPDVVLVGEARDRETISAAVTAAETGALVFATLHTYDAVSSLGRIVSTYPEGEQDQIRSQLAYVLKGVVSQTLVPAVQGGRTAAYEVLVSTPAVSNNLRKVDGLLQLRQVLTTSAAQGMQTMESHLAALVRRGAVRESDAEFKARDVEEFRRHLTLGGPAE